MSKKCLAAPILTALIIGLFAVACGKICIKSGIHVGTSACADPPASPAAATATPAPNLATWVTKTAMQTAHAYAVGGAIGSLFYVAGSSGTTAQEEYDPGASSWTSKASMPTSRTYVGGVVIGTKLYIAGGCVSGDCLAGLTGLLEAYDSGTNTWATKASIPVVLNSMGIGVVNGKLYAVGGMQACAPCTARTSLYVYDPTGDTWSTKTSMTTARLNVMAASVNNTLYAIGGATGNTQLATVEAYDPGSDTWSTKASMPTARSAATAAVVNGLIYVIGGSVTAGTTNIVEIYDPSSDSWTSTTSMPTARHHTASAAIGNVIYVGGGNDASNTSLATLEELQ